MARRRRVKGRGAETATEGVAPGAASQAGVDHPAYRAFSLWASLGIFAVAFAVRLVHLWSIRRAPFFNLLIGDARGYDAWALRVAGGDWIGHDVFYQAPLYPYFLAVIFRVAGHSLTLVRMVQAAVGSCACVLLAWAARRFFSPGVGLVAGLSLALYAPAIFFDELLQKSVLDVFFVCLSLCLISGITSRRDAGNSRRFVLGSWLALGVTLGCLTLTRENAIVFLLVIVAWAAWRFGAQAAVVVALGVALVLLPVAVRNQVVGGGFYLTTSQFGPNLFIGNHAGGDGTYRPLRYGRGAPEYERRDATELAEIAEGRSLTPAQVSRYWTYRAVAFMTSQPTTWVKLTARKIALLFNTAEIADTEDEATYADWSVILRTLAPVSRFGLLVPMALVGMIVTWPQRSRLAIVYGLLVAYAGSVALFYVFARYRHPLVPLLIVFAAPGVIAVVRAFRQPDGSAPTHDRLTITVLQIAGVMITAVIVNRPIESTGAMRAVTESNLGLALDADHRIDEAMIYYRRAIADDPDYAAAYDNLATALREKGRVDEAIAICQHALNLQPKMVAARYTLANLLLDKGQPLSAIDQFQRAIRDEPISADADAYNNFGIALAATGHSDQAVAEFQQALKLQPDMPGAHYNLANVRLAQGNATAAIEHFQRAAAGMPGSADVHNGLGIALASGGHNGEAAREFRRAVDLAPTSAKAYRNLGDALRADGNTSEGLAALRRAVELGPDDSDIRGDFARALNDNGVALGARGQFDEAIEQFQRALALEPELLQARHNLTTALQARRNEPSPVARRTPPSR